MLPVLLADPYPRTCNGPMIWPIVVRPETRLCTYECYECSLPPRWEAHHLDHVIQTAPTDRMTELPAKKITILVQPSPKAGSAILLWVASRRSERKILYIRGLPLIGARRFTTVGMNLSAFLNAEEDKSNA